MKTAIPAAAALLLSTSALSAQASSTEPPPIIDMHLHADRGTSGQSWERHPDVYADMSIVNSVMPEAAHAASLRAFADAGLLDRIVFGSDNMPVGPIIDRLEAVPFLTGDQRRAIYCDNAARFLGLEEGFCGTR